MSMRENTTDGVESDFEVVWTLGAQGGKPSGK